MFLVHIVIVYGKYIYVSYKGLKACVRLVFKSFPPRINRIFENTIYSLHILCPDYTSIIIKLSSYGLKSLQWLRISS